MASSIGGRLALPLVSAYNASKFGLEAVSDSLRRELRPHGVDVIVIEPGRVKTPIWRKGIELVDDRAQDVRQDAGDDEPQHGRQSQAFHRLRDQDRETERDGEACEQ